MPPLKCSSLPSFPLSAPPSPPSPPAVCRLVLADKDTSTDQDYARIEGVVAHEYFHNWTGVGRGSIGDRACWPHVHVTGKKRFNNLCSYGITPHSAGTLALTLLCLIERALLLQQILTVNGEQYSI
jgi:hypothetical protein